MGYPPVFDEMATLEAAITGRSLARVGEGEFRLAQNQKCISQVAHPKLMKEMLAVLALRETDPCLPCIPRLWKEMPKLDFWKAFTRPPFSLMLKERHYGSAFISRPDVAKTIDTPEYWLRVRDLWKNKDVTLVVGTIRSLSESNLYDAGSIRMVWGPQRDAYAVIDQIEEEIGKPAGPVLMCLGGTATILAMRLARKGVHALDLGHLGMFMDSPGIYMTQLSDFISPEYLTMQKQMHAYPEGYGGSGHHYAKDVMEFAKATKSEMVLDYGCGRGTLKSEMRKLGSKLIIHEYDPAIKGKNELPKPADLVVCTDVLEHIEPDKLGALLSHLWKLSKKAAYYVIATRLANKNLPDGRNAHILLHEPDWWIPLVLRSGWKNIERKQEQPGHSVRLWLRK